ncbi:hypothetical protein [Nonomuraea sp. NPDC049309]|uniref:hypothetical protein n=1 Tax=Nonomuraea sp. NPDC049309 TaxID=3364350 RepID=UPI00371A90D0
MAYPPQPQPQQPGPWEGAPGQGAPQGYGPQTPTGPRPPAQPTQPGPPTPPAYGQQDYGPSPYAQGGPPSGPAASRPGGAGTGTKGAAVVFTLIGLTTAAIIGLVIYFFVSLKDETGEVAMPTSRPSTAQPDRTGPPPETSTPAPTRETAPPRAPLTADEFGDWNFALDGVRFQASKVAGWTYDTCTPVDGNERVLRANGCRRAVQLAYSAYKGHLKALVLLMAFPDEQSAKSAADRLAELSSNAVRWRRDHTHADYVYGKILKGASKKYVVVTIVTADKTASKRAQSFHGHLHADHKAYFLWRDMS